MYTDDDLMDSFNEEVVYDDSFNEESCEEETYEEEPCEEYVYVTKSGKSYHSNPDCRTLKNHEFTKIPKSQIGDRKPCKRCCK